MNFSKYLRFTHLGITWRRISLFLIALFAVIGLQHFVVDPSFSASSSLSNAIASSSVITQNRDRLIAQEIKPDFYEELTPEEKAAYDALTPEQKARLSKLTKEMIQNIILIALACVAVIYVFTSFCLMKIADKLSIPNSWLAWIPIAQLWVMVRSAGKPGWWLILFFIPLVNIVIAFIILFATPTNLGKSPLFGLLAFIPILGIFLYYGLLAFT